jgi:hypothetical protein
MKGILMGNALVLPLFTYVMLFLFVLFLLDDNE